MKMSFSRNENYRSASIQFWIVNERQGMLNDWIIIRFIREFVQELSNFFWSSFEAHRLLKPRPIGLAGSNESLSRVSAWGWRIWTLPSTKMWPSQVRTSEGKNETVSVSSPSYLYNGNLYIRGVGLYIQIWLWWGGFWLLLGASNIICESV